MDTFAVVRVDIESTVTTGALDGLQSSGSSLRDVCQLASTAVSWAQLTDAQSGRVVGKALGVEFHVDQNTGVAVGTAGQTADADNTSIPAAVGALLGGSEHDQR